MNLKYRLWSIIFFTGLLNAQIYNVSSLDGKTKVTINTNNSISWSVSKNGKTILNNVTIALNLGDRILGENAKVISDKTLKKEDVITSIVAQKTKNIINNYNELQLRFNNDFEVHFRVYSEGVAYRFKTAFNKTIKIYSEKMEVDFPVHTNTYFPLEESLYSHYERSYMYSKLDTLTARHVASLPVLFENEGGFKVLFSEADLYDYPNMFVKGAYDDKVSALFPKVVLETKQLQSRPDRMEEITKEADFIAETNGDRSFPWRVFAITENDSELLVNDMVYKLSRPLEIKDPNWIKPGKVAWDWYNKNLLYNVDFKSGINTETYKYYIDFASQYGLEYVILDEGWSKTVLDIEAFHPDMDVAEIIRYGRSKDVGIILWCLWKPLHNDLQGILKTYESWGVAGIKVDFMQRADQGMVNIYTAIAKEAAKHKLLVDFHGAYKPSGLRRAYPNVLSFEGVRGSENNKWSNHITPSHNVTLPFIRSVVGPMDYTPGAMRNAHLDYHNVNFDKPVSLGTRAHQVAMYVVFESPLQMLCDSPSAYLEDQHTVEFISQIPTVWDETIPLLGKIGEYVALARKNKSTWYVGVMNNEVPRKLMLDFSFLPKGNFEAVVFKDGVNANIYAEDYKTEIMSINNKTNIELQLPNGGGWSAIIKNVN